MWPLAQTLNQVTFNVIFREIKEILKQFCRRTYARTEHSSSFGVTQAEQVGDDGFEIIQLNIGLLSYGECFEFKALVSENEHRSA